MNHSTAQQNLIQILRRAIDLLALPGNNFFWSGWEDYEEARGQIEAMLVEIEAGKEPTDLELLFLPTGPIQDVCLSSGWCEVFLVLASEFDKTITHYRDSRPPKLPEQ